MNVKHYRVVAYGETPCAMTYSYLFNDRPQYRAKLQGHGTPWLQKTVSEQTPMRVAAYWKSGTPWLGGWNYFLNMVRICNRFEPNIEFVLVNDGELEAQKRKDLQALGVGLVETKPRDKAYHLGLIGIRDRAFESALRSAGVDVVFELITFHGTRFGLPVLAWIPDFQHHMMPEFFPRKERIKRNIDYWLRLNCRRDVVLSSRAARSDMKSFCRTPRARIHVLPFAVQPLANVKQSGIRETLTRHSIERPYFFLPNQFWRHKNHCAAVDAAALASQSNPELLLVMSGLALDPRDDNHASQLIHRISDLVASGNVMMLGIISNSDLLHLIAGARAVINPSLFEGWSTTVEEAKALGTPLLLSSLSVHHEQAPSATFFDPYKPQELAEHMLRLLKMPSERSEDRIERARQSSELAQQTYASRLKEAFQLAASHKT